MIIISYYPSFTSMAHPFFSNLTSANQFIKNMGYSILCCFGFNYNLTLYDYLALSILLEKNPLSSAVLSDGGVNTRFL